MPNKGERILITKVSANCRAQRIACDPFDDEEGLFAIKTANMFGLQKKTVRNAKIPCLRAFPAPRPWREWRRLWPQMMSGDI